MTHDPDRQEEEERLLAEAHEFLARYNAVPLRVRHGDAELAFVSTVTTFGTPLDVTVAELVIESFFPADEATRKAFGR